MKISGHFEAFAGTDLEIEFIQYDPDPHDRIKQYLVPNSDKNGIVGIGSADISLPLTEEARKFLTLLFPQGKLTQNTFQDQLESGVLRFLNSDNVRVQLQADVVRPELKGHTVSLENVALTI